MPLETGNFVNDLVITNPPGTDLKSQGDDHLQLIKKVLKNTFPNATKPFPLPTSFVVSGSGAVTAAQQNSLIVVANGAAMTLTMPTLLTADAGWSINVLKLPGSVGPLFVAPPSGNIMSGQVSVAKARRNIPGVQFQVLWTGSNWVCGRCTNDPVGTVIPFFIAALPIGFEWANGQTLVAADYPEYVALRGGGSTPDCRERTFFGTNMGLASPGRINSVITPTLENGGGHQLIQSHGHGLTGTEVLSDGATFATHTHGGTTDSSLATGYDLTHSHGPPPGTSQLIGTGAATVQSGAGPGIAGIGSTGDSGSLNHAHSFGTSGQSAGHFHVVNAAGGGNAQNIPPTLLCNYVLVVE